MFLVWANRVGRVRRPSARTPAAPNSAGGPHDEATGQGRGQRNGVEQAIGVGGRLRPLPAAAALDASFVLLCSVRFHPALAPPRFRGPSRSPCLFCRFHPRTHTRSPTRACPSLRPGSSLLLGTMSRATLALRQLAAYVAHTAKAQGAPRPAGRRTRPVGSAPTDLPALTQAVFAGGAGTATVLDALLLIEEAYGVAAAPAQAAVLTTLAEELPKAAHLTTRTRILTYVRRDPLPRPHSQSAPSSSIPMSHRRVHGCRASRWSCDVNSPGCLSVWVVRAVRWPVFGPLLAPPAGRCPRRSDRPILPGGALQMAPVCRWSAFRGV